MKKIIYPFTIIFVFIICIVFPIGVLSHSSLLDIEYDECDDDDSDGEMFDMRDLLSGYESESNEEEEED